ncbi:MAG: hypothetical protein QOH97_1182 [Actinoplanes sp.]|nr:hypothetical protein [Actinoplanes sp.]
MNVDLTGANWSTGRSGGTGNCVEVATDLPMMPGHVAVRDSKNRTGPTLIFTDTEWEVFRLGVGDGHFAK